MESFISPYCGYYVNNQNGFIKIWDRDADICLLLEGEDADLFRQHIELLPEEITTEQIHKIIKIHIEFKTNCPMPQFITT
jgi:hypothetical protein